MRPTFCNFILGPYCVEKFRKNSHKYFHIMFAPCWGGMSIIKSQKKYIGKWNQNILFSKNRFCSLLIWVLLPLFIGSFGLKPWPQPSRYNKECLVKVSDQNIQGIRHDKCSIKKKQNLKTFFNGAYWLFPLYLFLYFVFGRVSLDGFKQYIKIFVWIFHNFST